MTSSCYICLCGTVYNIILWWTWLDQDPTIWMIQYHKTSFLMTAQTSEAMQWNINALAEGRPGENHFSVMNSDIKSISLLGHVEHQIRSVARSRFNWWRAGTSNYIPQLLWDVITCPCHWYLLLTQRISNKRLTFWLHTCSKIPNLLWFLHRRYSRLKRF